MSVQSSICTARVVAHVKRVMHALCMSLPTLMYSGPAKSMPVTANGFEGFTRSDGNGASICCPRGFLIVLHTRHVCRTLLIAWRALRTQNSFRSWDNMIRTPKWCTRMWVCRLSNSVKRWVPSSSSGCCCSLMRSAHCSWPPKRTSPSSKNGLKRAIFYPLGRGKFFRSDCRSAVKASSRTNLTHYIRATVRSVAVNPKPSYELVSNMNCT
jgi:hypothetical protein